LSQREREGEKVKREKETKSGREIKWNGGKKDREGERETKRETERERETERDTERQREIERDRERQRETERDRERQRGRRNCAAIARGRNEDSIRMHNRIYPPVPLLKPSNTNLLWKHKVYSIGSTKTNDFML
jgi:hypothetical protein